MQQLQSIPDTNHAKHVVNFCAKRDAVSFLVGTIARALPPYYLCEYGERCGEVALYELSGSKRIFPFSINT